MCPTRIVVNKDCPGNRSGGASNHASNASISSSVSAAGRARPMCTDGAAEATAAGEDATMAETAGNMAEETEAVRAAEGGKDEVAGAAEAAGAAGATRAAGTATAPVAPRCP